MAAPSTEFKVSGIWETALNDGAEVKVAGAWKSVTSIQRKDTTWKNVFVKSDPEINTYYADDVNSFRPTAVGGWRNNDTLYQGSWNNGDHIGIVTFDRTAIAARLAIRPVVTSATLRLKRLDSHGWGTTASTSLQLWQGASSVANASEVIDTASGQPDLVNGTIQPLAETWARLATKTVSIPTSWITDLGDETIGGIGMAFTSETLSNTGGEDTGYMQFFGTTAATAEQPLLTFTCDYV